MTLDAPPQTGSDKRERESRDRYEEYRAQQTASLRRAWEEAPRAFKKAATTRGIDVVRIDTGHRESVDALPFDENHPSTSYTPRIEDQIDTHIDQLIEKYGKHNEGLIRAIAVDLQIPMKLEIERSRGLMLGRIACYLVKGGKINVMARIHAILHSIPLLAKQMEFTSLRDSARDCGCSVQWLKVQRDRVCHNFGLPIPVEAQKTAEAKEKYRQIATERHWRNQKCNGQMNGHAKKVLAPFLKKK
jgi:hypothetical protein